MTFKKFCGIDVFSPLDLKKFGIGNIIDTLKKEY
jgi:hypothetical protein